MATAAQNLGDVMNSDLTSAVASAALKVTGFYPAVDRLDAAIQKYGANSPQAAAAARTVYTAWDNANNIAGQGIKNTETWQKKIDGMHGKNININMNFSASGDLALFGSVSAKGGGGSSYTLTPGGYAGRAAGGFIDGPGTSTSDSIHARLSRGEYVVNADAVGHYGQHLFDALNAKKYASGGIRSAARAPAPSVLRLPCPAAAVTLR